MSHSKTTLERVSYDSFSSSLSYLRATFLLHGADMLHLRYEGQFGERAVSRATLLTRKGRYCAFELSLEVRREFTELCMKLLDSRYPDWATGYGSEGSFAWDLHANGLIHAHALRARDPSGEHPPALESETEDPGDIPF